MNHYQPWFRGVSSKICRNFLFTSPSLKRFSILSSALTDFLLSLSSSRFSSFNISSSFVFFWDGWVFSFLLRLSSPDRDDASDADKPTTVFDSPSSEGWSSTVDRPLVAVEASALGELSAPVAIEPPAADRTLAVVDPSAVDWLSVVDAPVADTAAIVHDVETAIEFVIHLKVQRLWTNIKFNSICNY